MSTGFAIWEEGSLVSRTADFDENEIISEIPFADGRKLFVSGEMDYKQMERKIAELEDANQAKEVFLSNMSHDIRTPMNAIVGMTAIAKNHIDEKSKVMDALNKIETASSHLLSLINEVLDMSRIDSGKMKISNETFSLSDLLHETMTVIKPQMEQKQHHFTLSTENILYENLCGDVLRLRQIYVNIINNAVKYTEEKGDIRIQISEEIQEDTCNLVFSCKDNGIGMSEEFLAKIFDPFERAESTTMSKVEGTGLGMSIVKKLIEAMDGNIEIISREGKGTVVTIRIPLSYSVVDMHAEQLKGKKILIFESDAETADLYHRYLDEYKISHTVVPSASEVISALADSDFRNETYDALIIGKKIDNAGNIFDISGYVHKAYPKIHIILASEDDWSQIEYHANRSGIERFIPVPFFRKSLINGLNSVFEGDDHETGAFGKAVNLEGKHILLVEDNFINMEIAKEILSYTNADVHCAENGQQAVDAFAQSSDGYYDLILMDVQMPVMDGYTAVKTIRALNRKDAGIVKIFAMTANTFAEDIEKARQSGMDGHIAKPIDIQKLMSLLRQLI